MLNMSDVNQWLCQNLKTYSQVSTNSFGKPKSTRAGSIFQKNPARKTMKNTRWGLLAIVLAFAFIEKGVSTNVKTNGHVQKDKRIMQISSDLTKPPPNGKQMTFSMENSIKTQKQAKIAKQTYMVAPVTAGDPTVEQRITQLGGTIVAKQFGGMMYKTLLSRESAHQLEKNSELVKFVEADQSVSLVQDH